MGPFRASLASQGREGPDGWGRNGGAVPEGKGLPAAVGRWGKGWFELVGVHRSAACQCRRRRCWRAAEIVAEETWKGDSVKGEVNMLKLQL